MMKLPIAAHSQITASMAPTCGQKATIMPSRISAPPRAYTKVCMLIGSMFTMAGARYFDQSTNIPVIMLRPLRIGKLSDKLPGQQISGNRARPDEGLLLPFEGLHEVVPEWLELRRIRLEQI